MAECGLSTNTLAAYRSDIVRFSRWRKEHAPGPLAKVDIATLAGYVDHLARSGLAPSSVGRHLASLSTFFRFLIFEGKLAENVAKLLIAPAVWDRLPNVLGPSAVERLLEAADPSTRLGRRDHARAPHTRPTRRDAGRPRSSGSARVTSTSSSRDRPGASARGTRNGWSRSGLRAAVGPGVAIWAEDRPGADKGGDPDDGIGLRRQVGLAACRRVGLWRVVEGSFDERRGCPEHVSPHTLRHSFATHMLVEWGRPPCRPGDARSRLDRHDPDLHPCRAGAAPPGPRRIPPEGLGLGRGRRPDQAGSASGENRDEPVLDDRPEGFFFFFFFFFFFLHRGVRSPSGWRRRSRTQSRMGRMRTIFRPWSPSSKAGRGPHRPGPSGPSGIGWRCRRRGRASPRGGRRRAGPPRARSSGRSWSRGPSGRDSVGCPDQSRSRTAGQCAEVRGWGVAVDDGGRRRSGPIRSRAGKGPRARGRWRCRPGSC